MSKLSFRARALDASKPLPIYLDEEIPDSADCSLINRAVPQMPTGMEKEEEAEHHLQQAIVAGTIIPTPEVYVIENTDYYDRIYPETFKLPRQLIYMQPFSMETDIPDYDMDSEDEKWIHSQMGKLELTPDKFEEMMDRLEKDSGQTVITLQEAKALIKEDDDLIIAVYDYWLTKRLKFKNPLVPHVRTEARHGTSANHNPYVAFRRRTEKMQTRKNRKNDETSYEKMLKLKRDLTRAVTLLEMVKKREKSKRDLLHLTIEVFEKRTRVGDYSGQVVNEVMQQRPARPAFTPLYQTNSLGSSWIKEEAMLASLSRKERRQYKKRRHKSSSKSHIAASGSAYSNYANAQGHQGLSLEGEGGSSEEDLLQPASPSDGEDEDEGVFAFKRRKDCEYLAPADNGDWPWCTNKEIDSRLKFYPTFISDSKGGYRSVGPCRRRVARGGRIVLDRMSISDLRSLCRAWKYNPLEALSTTTTTSTPGVSSSKSNLTSKAFAEPSTSRTPSDGQSQSFVSSIPRSPSPDLTTAPLGCWHYFAPPSPLLLEPSSDPPLCEQDEMVVSDGAADDANLCSSPVPEELSSGNSCHLGLVFSKGDKPVSYPVELLLSDPPLHQNPRCSNVPLTSVDNDGDEDDDDEKILLLDDHMAELQHAAYYHHLMDGSGGGGNDNNNPNELFADIEDMDGTTTTTTSSCSLFSSSLEESGNSVAQASAEILINPSSSTVSLVGTSTSSSEVVAVAVDSASCTPPPETTQLDSSPENTSSSSTAAIVNVKSGGEEADAGGKTAAAAAATEDTSQSSSREYNKSYAVLISV